MKLNDLKQYTGKRVVLSTTGWSLYGGKLVKVPEDENGEIVLHDAHVPGTNVKKKSVKIPLMTL